VEAPRGTLFHHYKTDDRGMVEKVNLIVATGNNNAAMCMSVKSAAQAFIKAGEVNLPGQMPLEVVIRDSGGQELKRLGQYLD